MSKDDRCPMCDTPRKQTAYWGACEVCGHCGMPVRLWENARMIRRQSEIGARAVEVLHQIGLGYLLHRSRVMQEVAEPILSDARAAGMVP